MASTKDTKEAAMPTRCHWQPLLSERRAFCFLWHAANTKWRSGFDGNELAGAAAASNTPKREKWFW